MLKEDCSCSENLTSLMGQPIITLHSDSPTALEALKTEVSDLINRHLPKRDQDIIITVRRQGIPDASIKVFKTA